MNLKYITISIIWISIALSFLKEQTVFNLAFIIAGYLITKFIITQKENK
jgi:hypothetical protein